MDRGVGGDSLLKIYEIGISRGGEGDRLFIKEIKKKRGEMG